MPEKRKRIFLLLLGLLLSAQLLADDVAKYTNKNEVSLKGHADPNVVVNIYVDDKKVDSVNCNDAGEWFASDVPVPKDGENSVYAMAVSDDGSKSRISTRLKVIVDKIPPRFYQINVDPKSVKPSETLHISAKTDKDVDTISAVLPDNSVADLIPPRGRDAWSYDWVVPRLISGGVYRILLIATDKAGNVSQETSEEIMIDAEAALQISTPEDGSITYDDLVNVKGLARNCSYVMINGEKTLIEQDGQFSGYAKMTQPGKNTIQVKSYNPAGVAMEKSLNLVKLVTYPDIKVHWARRAIEYLATLGYVQAYPNTNMFAPDNNISRAELAALLVRTKQYPLDNGGLTKGKFLDVQGNFWAVGYIETAARYGIVEGYPGNIYKPQNMVTRAEAVAMMVRFAGIPVMKVERATDIDVSAGHWAASYIAAFKSGGLMPVEWKNNRFFPDKPITRAEICAILARVPEINMEIEQLINRKTNWDYAIDNSYYEKQPGYSGYTEQNAAVPANTNPSAPTSEEAGSIVIGIASPREVMAGNDINLTVATLIKMKKVEAVFPDTARLPLQFNNSTELWEINWKVPSSLNKGSYSIVLEAAGENGKNYHSRSNDFKIYNEAEAVNARQKNVPAVAENLDLKNEQKTVFESNPADVEFTYPEYSEIQGTAPAGPKTAAQQMTPASVKPTAAKKTVQISGGLLTRAKLTAILAKYHKLRYAKVTAPPAKDVPLSNPQVNTIKSAIVTGIVPNLSPNKFYPDKYVTKLEAIKIMKKAKLSPVNCELSNENITESEFDNWVKKSVK